ncbi:RHS repeat-associated core domain-containing protein [Pseudomonas sp. PDM03]|uniref:RHS repeat domain-containing protein n=1 Tax=Pseudomonas TaxID=286 RepID=UPI00178098B7|nr:MULTISPECIES: RHS repeat-associated core domain-containing protein [Pseudomonas]MBD9591095.1 RHS repeat-associated core domain-containing protein [Pseudomonas sp. PDM03]MCP1516492.1 insecticidal toxin complex protein TccC [Pseudomonas migulae]
MDAQVTAMHRHTPKLIAIDSRSLAVRSVDYYRAAEEAVPEAQVNRTVHDPAGRAIAQRDSRLSQTASAPANLVTTHGLSGTALCTLSVDAGLRLSLFGEAGQPVQSWDGRGSKRWMHYDNQLRLTALFEQTLEGATVCAERLTYAANDPVSADHNQSGQLISHTDLAGVLLFNDYGLTAALLEQERRLADIAQSFSTHSRFNPPGDLLSRTDAQGNEQRFSQTVDGQLRAVGLRLSNTTQHLPMVSAITYNAHGQVEREVAGNGVITTLEYAAEDGRLQRLLSRLGQNQPLQDLRYTFDPVGNVLSIEDAALPIRYFANQRIEPVCHFWYDTLYRLIAATGWEAGSVRHGPSSAMTADPAMPGNYRQTYRYDAGHNLLELTHTGPQNPGHRLVADAHSNRCLPVCDGIEPTEQDFRDSFDANGNLLKLQPGQTLRWDGRNQLCEVCPVARDTENDSEHYVYGADGMRVRKVRSLQTNAQTKIIETLYLPGLEVRTHSGTGEVLHVINVQAGRSNVRVLHWDAGRPTEISNNQQRYSLTDRQGSSTLELDQDANVITQERFYPFGGTSWWNGTTVQVSYKTVRYSGKERDATGLYYYGFRYYVPWLQRWLNPDPAGAIDGLNFYAMVRNNPMVLRDYNGLAGDELFNASFHELDLSTQGWKQHLLDTQLLNLLLQRYDKTKGGYEETHDYRVSEVGDPEYALTGQEIVEALESYRKTYLDLANRASTDRKSELGRSMIELSNQAGRMRDFVKGIDGSDASAAANKPRFFALMKAKPENGKREILAIQKISISQRTAGEDRAFVSGVIQNPLIRPEVRGGFSDLPGRETIPVLRRVRTFVTVRSLNQVGKNTNLKYVLFGSTNNRDLDVAKRLKAKLKSEPTHLLLPGLNQQRR